MLSFYGKQFYLATFHVEVEPGEYLMISLQIANLHLS